MLGFIFVVVVGFGTSVKGIYPYSNYGALLICCMPLAFFTLMLLPWNESLAAGHKCRECENTHITDGNVLGYPPGDMSVLDVPEKLIHRHQYMLY
jgi:hypothetical protein